MAKSKKTKAGGGERPSVSDPKAPLSGKDLLATARPVLQLLRTDLATRAQDPVVAEGLLLRYEGDKADKRTADSFPEWQTSFLAQVAASWFLSCVFVRTLEDRGLLDHPRLAGPGATDSQTLFFELAPSLTERDYLLFCFRELAELPAARDLFDRDHALVWQLSPSADAAKELLRLFRTPNAEAPGFRFGQASTRFLGDLYQDLYEDVRERFALLQTPDFVESFILDRTLEPAIERFGLDDTTIIDPTCGSGHFLLGAFDRIFEHRLRAEPGLDVMKAAEKALGAVYGADINPYAVAIARMRLTLSFVEKAGIRWLKDAPRLPLHLVVADSLLHNPQQKQLDIEHQEGQRTEAWRLPAFQLEDEAAARDVLHRQYAAVVGNPPYIVQKDAALRDQYRKMYQSAVRQFSLAAPFCERFFQLARSRGFVGQITANSFMKREFGKKLIENYLKSINLHLIVNTSGAYIPGHGTPTVLLFGTHELPQNSEVAAVLAKRGEPSTPVDPAKGEVWSSIARHWNEPSFDNDYISVANLERAKLSQHPWSLGGGGALELKELLEERSAKRLSEIIDVIGRTTHTGEDGVFFVDKESALRLGFPETSFIDLVKGEQVRDWAIADDEVSLFPYNKDTAEPVEPKTLAEKRFYWTFRTVLKERQDFGQKIEARGLRWFEHSMFFPERFKTPLSITFAFVATHNHFVLDRGGKVFKQSAPIIKLPATATEDDHLALLAYLNSSTACFWMKQVMMNKGATSDAGVLQADEDKFRFEFDGTKMQRTPIPSMKDREKLIALAREACDLSSRINPKDYVDAFESDQDLILAWKQTDEAHRRAYERLVAVQEDVDWLVYEDFGLVVGPVQTSETSVAYPAGERPFSAAANQTLDELRIERSATISDSPHLMLIESAEFKRRWYRSQGKFKAQEIDAQSRKYEAVKIVALNALEVTMRSSLRILGERELKTSLASLLPRIELAQLSFQAGNVDGPIFLSTLLEVHSVPFVGALRYSDAGIVNWHMWLQAWSLQRQEDAGDSVDVSLPPKFGPKDFRHLNYFALRGKLDVPKERFISYPGCESDEDGQPVYGWAGWNHLQRSQALAALYQKRKTDEGWAKNRLTPMLAGLLELLPWVKQWHNQPNAEFGGLRMGDYFEQFLDGECQTLGLARGDLEAWRPETRATKRASKAAAKNTSRIAAKVGGKEPETEATHGSSDGARPGKVRRKLKLKKASDSEELQEPAPSDRGV